jgi:hypothetical protein
VTTNIQARNGPMEDGDRQYQDFLVKMKKDTERMHLTYDNSRSILPPSPLIIWIDSYNHARMYLLAKEQALPMEIAARWLLVLALDARFGNSDQRVI